MLNYLSFYNCLYNHIKQKNKWSVTLCKDENDMSVLADALKFQLNYKNPPQKLNIIENSVKLN